MRIFVLTGDYPPVPSGVGDYVCHLARSLNRRGHEIYILTAANKSLSDELNDGVKVFRRVVHWNRTAFPLIEHFFIHESERIQPTFIPAPE